MYNNQDILRKHTALTLGRKRVDTSFIMFPVRLETRFVDDHPVEDVSEPDLALYAFQALWNYVGALEKPDKNQLLGLARQVMRKVEELDTVYREDRTRLRNLAAKIVDAVKPEGEEKAVWDRVLVHVDRLTTMATVVDSEATDFLNRLEHVNKTIQNLYRKRFYAGKDRSIYPKEFSQTAYVNFARKRLQDCLPVLEMLLPENPADTIVNKFALLTDKQVDRFENAFAFFEVSRENLSARYGRPSQGNKKSLSLKQEIIDGFNRDLDVYEKYRICFLGMSGRPSIKGRKWSLINKVRSRKGDYCRYTQFAEKLILWRLRLFTGQRRDYAPESRVERWRILAVNTIFSFHEEREWLRSVLKCFNAYKESHGQEAQKVSLDRLNRHTKVIRPRKLRYLKNQKCLLVRLYPDEVAVTQMSKPLTKDEVNHALDFWIRYAYEYDNERKQMAAWESLCALYTAPRAALIARSLFHPSKTCILQMLEQARQYRRKGASFDKFEAYIRPLMVSQLETNGVDDSGTHQFSTPMSELMPDRFILQATLDNGKRKGVTIIRYGHLIPKTIQVGLDLNREPQMSSSGTGIRFDDNLRWMTDYGEAEKMGMAITLPLEAFKWEKQDKAKKGKKPRTFRFSSIYVMGVKDFSPDNAEDSKACSALLKQVFNAHLYSEDGLELLKVGTPTNILTDEDGNAAKGGNPSDNSDYDTGVDALVNEFYRKSIVPYANMQTGTPSAGDAAILSSLFGINGYSSMDPFRCTANRDNQEVQKSRVVNAAFLEVLKNVHPILRLLIDSKRLAPYFKDHVLATGVFPSFRIGNQPYGILPVCDFKNLRYKYSDPLRLLKAILVYLTEKWNRIAGKYVLSEENINTQTKLSTEESYLKMASCTPVSSSFYDRPAFKEDDLLPVDFFKGTLSEIDPIHDVYQLVKGWCASKTEEEFIKQYFPKFNYLPIRDFSFASFLQDFNWGNLKREIKKKVNAEDCMAGVTDAELERLISGTFDLFNYRLDAWLTGLLSQRYESRLASKRHKISIGAYGWVFNLKEDAQEPVSNEFVIAPSVNQAVTAAVLRSSFNRAANGQSKDYNLSVNLSSSRVRQALRIIQGIRNGLSLGTILGSDLERMLHDDHKKPGGYEMDFFIYYLRKEYPLNRTDTQYAAGDSVKRDSSLDVLNGVALLEDMRNVKVDNQQKLQLTELYDWKTHSGAMWNWLSRLFPGYRKNDIQTIVEEPFQEKTKRLVQLIQRMEDAYDALADVVTSESVYKLTEGNRVAVDALMNSMNTGRNFPEPDVVEIPLHSAHIEERVFAALDPDVKTNTTPTESYFRKMEPSLDQWMGQMLGIDDIRVQLTIDGGTATYPLAKPVAEGGLGVSASDLVYLSDDWDKFWHFLSLQRWQKGEDLHVKRLPAGGILLQEAEMAVDSMREMVVHARPLKQEDLIVSTVSPDETLYDSILCIRRYSDASSRVMGLVRDLKNTAAEVEKHFAESAYLPLTEALFRKVVGHLLYCFRLGLTDALSEIDPETLLVAADFRFEQPVEFNRILACQLDLANKMRNNAAVLEERIEQAKAVIDAGKKGDEWETYPDAMKKLLGSYFVMVPHFKLQGNEAIASDQLSRQTPGYFTNAGKAVVEDNLVGLSDVRTQMQALHQIRMYGKMNFLDAARDIRPMQLEAEPRGDRNWMGVQVKDESSVRDASVYTVLNPSALIVPEKDGLREVAGLMIDYWVERIPYRNQTAAVAFGYDQPDAEPPQAILLGMSPLGGRHNWSEKRLLRMIRSAMHQVKTRAVEPEHIYQDEWTSALFPLLSIDAGNTTN